MPWRDLKTRKTHLLESGLILARFIRHQRYTIWPGFGKAVFAVYLEGRKIKYNLTRDGLNARTVWMRSHNADQFSVAKSGNYVSATETAPSGVAGNIPGLDTSILMQAPNTDHHQGYFERCIQFRF